MIFVACSTRQRVMLIAPKAKCTNASVALKKIEDIKLQSGSASGCQKK